MSLHPSQKSKVKSQKFNLANLPSPPFFYFLLFTFYFLLPQFAAANPRRTPIVEAVERTRGAVVNIHSERTVRAPGTEELFAMTPSLNRVNGMGTGILIDRAATSSPAITLSMMSVPFASAWPTAAAIRPEWLPATARPTWRC